MGWRRTTPQTPEPEEERQGLEGGSVVFRLALVVWMITFNIVAGGLRRPILGYASLAAAAVWSALLVRMPALQNRRTVLIGDLALSTYLIVVSGLVQPPGSVTGSRLFFANAYPVATPIMWGLALGVRGGLFSGLVVSAALALSRPVNGIEYQAVSQVVNVANGCVYFLVAGAVMGMMSEALDRSSARIRRATDAAMLARERAGALAERAFLAREIHDSVLQVLGFVKKRGQELSLDGPVDAQQVGELARMAGEQEQALRDLITRETDEAPSGMTSLADALRRTRRGVPGLDVTVSSVGPVWLPAPMASELCAAVHQALDNVAKHAGTHRAFVFVEQDEAVLLVSVRDNGRGFRYAPEELRAAGKAGILESMGGRVRGLGGRMRVESAPGLGTTVEFQVPVSGRGSP